MKTALVAPNARPLRYSTVTAWLSDEDPNVAVMVELPPATPVTVPAATVATFVMPEDHVASRVKSLGAGEAQLPLPAIAAKAVKPRVEPTFTV